MKIIKAGKAVNLLFYSFFVAIYYEILYNDVNWCIIMHNMWEFVWIGFGQWGIVRALAKEAK